MAREEQGEGTGSHPAAHPGGLSSKLVALTVLFVMTSVVLVYVPSIASFRINALSDAHETAAIAAVVLASDTRVDSSLEAQLLDATGAQMIVLDDHWRRRLLTRDGSPARVAVHVDLDNISPVEAVLGAFDTLVFGGGRLLRVTGEFEPAGGDVEVVMPEDTLRAAMFDFSGNLLLLSLLASMVTGVIVYVSLRRLTVRPMQALTAAMDRFAEAPGDPDRVIVPSGRRDEIGDAEVRLRAMQEELGRTIHQQRRLAELGLAVSKINHDLRNLLASAQIFSERLAAVSDPTVQRIAPKMVRTLDRAIAYTRSVLAYGAAREAPPERRIVSLPRLIADVSDVVGIAARHDIVFDVDVPRDFEVDADPDQLFRVLVNLTRNAVEALDSEPDGAVVRRLTISAARTGAVARVRVSDTGPGVPARAREHLFQPFHGSVRPGGTGLGLAIAAELVRAHGGQIALVSGPPGAVFEIVLPDRPVDLAAVRRAARR